MAPFSEIKILIVLLAFAVLLGCDRAPKQPAFNRFDLGVRIVTKSDPETYEARHEFEYTNSRNHAISLKSATTSCGCLDFQIDKKTIEPGDTAKVSLSYSIGYAPQARREGVSFEVDGESEPVTFELAVFGYPGVTVLPYKDRFDAQFSPDNSDSIEFKAIGYAPTASDISVEFSNAENLKIEKSESSHDVNEFGVHRVARRIQVSLTHERCQLPEQLETDCVLTCQDRECKIQLRFIPRSRVTATPSRIYLNPQTNRYVVTLVAAETFSVVKYDLKSAGEESIQVHQIAGPESNEVELEIAYDGSPFNNAGERVGTLEISTDIKNHPVISVPIYCFSNGAGSP